MAGISSYLDPRLITFLDVRHRDEAIQQMIQVLKEHNVLPQIDTFHKAILEREKIVSTGIGMGVAVPHAKVSFCHHFFVVIGILSQGIDWRAIDNIPVKLIFMIGGPDDKQTEYLQILSSLTLAMKDEERRKKMLQLTNPQEIIGLFKTF